MAKHKAATEITVVHEERSAFAEWVDKYKWPALGLLAVVSAVILFRTRQAQSAVESQRSAWGELYTATTEVDDRAAGLEAAAQKADGRVASVALFQASALRAAEGDSEAISKAKTDLLNIGNGNANPILTDLKLPLGPDGEDTSLVAAMESRLDAESAWMEEFGRGIYENEPLPEGAPRVELNTEAGRIVVGLYEDLAPEHVANFLKLTREGAYDGTRFHRTMTGQFIQGGDPNSKDAEAADTWGQGGPGYKIAEEKTGLIHTAGVLAAAKMGGDKESSGSQFYITAQPMHGFDNRYVVYGAVIEGLEVVEEISNRPTKEDNPESPAEAVVLESAKVLE